MPGKKLVDRQNIARSANESKSLEINSLEIVAIFKGLLTLCEYRVVNGLLPSRPDSRSVHRDSLRYT